MMLRSLRRQTFAAISLLLAGLVGAPGCSHKVAAPPEPPESVRLGDDAFIHEEYEAAIRHYGDYIEVVEHGEYTPRAYYKSAHASYRLGDYPETIATLDQLESRYPGTHWVQVDALRGDAQREMRHYVEAIVAWDAGLEIATDTDRPKLRQRMAAIVGDLDGVDLTRARQEATSPITLALLEQEIAARQPAGAPDTAVAAVEDVEPAAEEAAEADADDTPVVGLRPIASEPGTTARPGYGAAQYQRGPNRRSNYRVSAAEPADGGGEAGTGEVVELDAQPVAAGEPAADASVDAEEAAPTAAVDGAAPVRLVPVDAATGEPEPKPVAAVESAPAAAKLVKIDSVASAPAAEPSVVVVEDAEVPPAPQPARLVRIEPAGDGSGEIAPASRPVAAPAAAPQAEVIPAEPAPLDGLEKLDVPDIGEPLP